MLTTVYLTPRTVARWTNKLMIFVDHILLFAAFFKS